MATNRRSFVVGLLLAGALAISALSTAYHRATEGIVAACGFCWRWLTAAAQDVVATLAGPLTSHPVPGITRTQARQFMSRQAQRERPIVTPGWRAVPSI